MQTSQTLHFQHDIMPSFDIVSEIDAHELQNAIDQTRRELANRFDFKDSDAKVDYTPPTLILQSESAFQVKQINGILEAKLSRRGIDIRCLQAESIQESQHRATQHITVRQGLDKDQARRIVKQIKDTKLKVQSAIQGDRVRVSGKKRDDLQTVIASVKDSAFDLPLQFVNFRD